MDNLHRDSAQGNEPVENDEDDEADGEDPPGLGIEPVGPPDRSLIAGILHEAIHHKLPDEDEQEGEDFKSFHKKCADISNQSQRQIFKAEAQVDQITHQLQK